MHEITKWKEQLLLRGCQVLRIPYCQSQLHVVHTVVTNQVQQCKDTMCCGGNVTSYCIFTLPSHKDIITITSVEEIPLYHFYCSSHLHKKRLSGILSLCNETVVILDEDMVTQCVNSVLHILVVGSTNSATRWLCQQHSLCCSWPPF